VLSRSGIGGFTLVELLVGMALVGVLIALGAPSMSNYLQNSKIANATSGYYSAIQTARTEAIRRNVLTEFVLTDAPFSSMAPASAARSWAVRASSPLGFVRIDAKDAAEGEGNRAAPTLAITGTASPIAFDGTIAFNGFGATMPAGTSYSLDIKNPAAGTCKNDGGTIRCRRITVSPGGQIAACDPAAAASAGDSRACPP
jgi:type IV fimbrial biogenesis protein FimT